jgi:raffinose/stachyose/melibiose transport system substrate-binding protein
MKITARRRVIVTIAAASVLAVTLGACSGGNAGKSSGAAKSITLMTTWNDPVSKKVSATLFAGFTKATGIKVVSDAQSGNGATYQPAVRTAMSSSKPPTGATDIAGPEVFAMAKGGVLKDLTSFYNKTIKPRALGSAATQGMVLGGKIYGISAGTSIGNLLFYNPTYLAKYGVDATKLKTFAEWKAALAKIKAAGGEGVVIGAKDQWPGGHYLNDLVQREIGSAATTTLYNRSTVGGEPDSPKWTDPAVVKALKDYISLKPLFQDGFLGEDNSTAGAEFLAGKAGFYEQGSWFLSTIESTPPAFKTGVMLFPAVSGGAGNGKEITLDQSALIISKSSDTKAAEAFMEYFTRPTVAAKLQAGFATAMPYKTTKGIASVPSLVKDNFNSINGFVTKAGPNGSALFNDQAIATAIYSKYIWQGSVGLMSGAVTPEQLAGQLETATEAAQKANK